MTIYEARRLLNTDEHESIRTIRKRYLQLMKEAHPDNHMSASHLDAVLLNEAYHCLLACHDDAASENGEEGQWDADIIPEAFCERTVYVQHSFDDGLVHYIPMAEGKYLWNPDAEDFSMLMKSVYETAFHLAGREDQMIFHYLMQQFIDPVYALARIPEPWVFRCRAVPFSQKTGSACTQKTDRAYTQKTGSARAQKTDSARAQKMDSACAWKTGSACARKTDSACTQKTDSVYTQEKRKVFDQEKGKVFAASSRLYVTMGKESVQQILFPEKWLNYVVTPLIQAGSAVGESDGGRLRISLTEKPFIRDFQKANALIRSRVK